MQWIDLDILGQQIERLDGGQFVRLGNMLLNEFVVSRGLDRTCLTTNLQVTEPDGGIDARCVNIDVLAGRLIPRNNVDYQFKSGSRAKSASAASIVRDDIINKPRVLEGIKNGHAFVYVAAWDRGDAFENEIYEEIQRQGHAIEKSQIIFFGQNNIASLLRSFPGLVTKFIGIDVPLISIDQWAGLRSLSNPFQSDESVENRLVALRTQIDSPNAIVRVVGAAGNGKTRTVLKALEDSLRASSVLYARQVSDVTPSFMTYLQRTPDVQCTLVIDEVDDVEAEKLSDRFSIMPPGVRLLMIGLDASGRAQPRTLQIEGLSENLLVSTISSIVPALPEDIARSIARECEHSPKLAVLIAGRIRDEPSLIVPHGILADGTIWSVLDRYLNISQNSSEWEALSIAALLMRLGWSEEAEYESELLFSAVEREPISARRQVHQLHERFGIAPLAGRFRYISPAILADYLAAKQLDAWTRNKLVAVFSVLTPTMADSFALRTRRLSAVLSNRAVVEEVILGAQGPFRSLADLEANKIARVLRHLAAPFPRATLAALKRIIGDSSSEELRVAKESRRDIVWALEELLWPQETFEEAVTLLLKLALAENETWGNNATNTWIETFQTALGRTSAGLIPRTRILKRSASSKDATERQISAKAIGAALKFEHIHRSGGPPTDVKGMPSEAWEPTTWGEWAQLVKACLDILTPLLDDDDIDVRNAAVNALSQGLLASLQLPGTIDSWVTAARSLIGKDYSLRSQIINGIEWMKLRWEDQIENGLVEKEIEGDEEDNKEAINSAKETMYERLSKLESVMIDLRGQDFSSRFRETIMQTVRHRPGNKEYDLQEQRVIQSLEDLAKDVITNPDLIESEWEWLIENNEWWSLRWFQILGKMDIDRVFENKLKDLSKEHKQAIMWLSLYYISYAQSSQDPAFIDQRVIEMKQHNLPWLQIIDLLFRAGYTSSRLSMIVDLLITGKIKGEMINGLAYSPWGKNIPPEEAHRLIGVAVEHTENTGFLAPFVFFYLEQRDDAKSLFIDLGIKIITETTINTEVLNSISLYEWSKLALAYVDQAPKQVAAAALKIMAMAHHIGDAQLYSIVKRAWEIGNKEQLFIEIIAPHFTDEWPAGWHIREELKGFPLEDIGTAFIMDWVAIEPEKRAPALASVIGPPHEQFSDLHATLLEQFDEYGVGDNFYSSFMSGSWTGSISAWTRSKLVIAEGWLNDKRPTVQEWAQNVIQGLRERLTHYEMREAEDRFLG